MNTRFAIYATAIIVVMVGLLLLRAFVTVAPQQIDSGYLDPYKIRGTELVFKGKPYTLNFEQQQEAVELINRCIPIGKLRGSPIPPPGMDKIVVYLFDKKPVELTPINVSQDEFTFKAPALNSEGYLLDVSAGRLWRLLETAHDP